MESSVTKTQYGSLGGQLLLGLGPLPLPDAGRDFLHPGSMAHGMHPLSSTIPHTVEAASPATDLSVSNPQTSPPPMQEPGQSCRRHFPPRCMWASRAIQSSSKAQIQAEISCPQSLGFSCFGSIRLEQWQWSWAQYSFWQHGWGTRQHVFHLLA